MMTENPGGRGPPAPRACDAAAQHGSGGLGVRGVPLDWAGPVFKNAHPTKIFSTPAPVSH